MSVDSAPQKEILLDVVDDVAILTLNRPAALNSLSNEMSEQFRQALEDLSQRKPAARALVITGAGRGFCAGADLVSVINPDDPTVANDVGMVLERHYNPIVKAMRALPMPIIAAVNGACAGAGMSFAIAADIVIAAKSASFLQAFVNIGLVSDAGSSYYLPRLVGRARAARMMLLGEKVSAEQAYDWGLIAGLAEDDKLMDDAMKIARKLAAGPTYAINLMRHMLDVSEGNSLSDQLDLERINQRDAGRSEDFKEGVAAFLAKRKPTFIGK